MSPNIKPESKKLSVLATQEGPARFDCLQDVAAEDIAITYLTESSSANHDPVLSNFSG